MSNTFVFTFGRMNPPTRGHVYHASAMKVYAEQFNFDYCVYVSKTVDGKKNPISPETKIEYLKKAFNGDLNVDVSTNMFSVLQDIAAGKKYKNIVYFAGNDYFTDPTERSMFDRLVVEAKKHNISLEVKPSGQRTEGISGTSLRSSALAGDFNTFLNASPNGIGQVGVDSVIHIYDAVRKGLT